MLALEASEVTLKCGHTVPLGVPVHVARMFANFIARVRAPDRPAATIHNRVVLASGRPWKMR